MIAFNRHARLPRGGSRRPARTRRAIGAGLGVIGAFLMAGLVAAHPLGNFTINHYAGLRIEPDRILLDIVIDQAEIPAFQARLAIDLDGDGELSAAETETGRMAACTDLASSLDLIVDGRTQATRLTEAGLTFPPGAGGLSTMRTVCGFEATLSTPIDAGTDITFADRSFAERIGWREIVVEGSGVEVAPAAPADAMRSSSPSSRLTEYPADLLTRAPADTQVAIVATPGGPALAPHDIPDADPVDHPAGAVIDGPAPAQPAEPAEAASVPGGVTIDEIPSIFRTVDLTPVVLLVSLLTAAVLGAGHALTPGHGKTLMAAYLVGSRGTPVHAAGLGLSVALSHTLGILALAGLVVGAQGVLPYDVVVTATPVIAALSIVAIGGWMLLAEGRRRWRTRVAAAANHGHDHDYGHDHGLDHNHGHDHDYDHGQTHDHANGQHDIHDHDHAPPTHEDAVTPGTHSHGGVRHSHLPADGSTISWRSLFVLGLAGGLIPSASALLILLSSIAAGRPAFGFVLVVAFGLGMALVMGGIGLTLVLARGRLDRVNQSTPLARASAYLPLVASFVVLGFGLFLTIQAVSGNTTL